VLVAHLSDLHLRDAGDVIWLERQLDRIVARAPDHLAITGDLLDRWQPALLERALDAIAARGLFDPARLTILHGNHDLASGGGHPQAVGDLWRLALRFWDPPPLLASRRRAFYRAIARRGAGVARGAPWHKPLSNGATIAVVNTVPAFWAPVRIDGRVLVVRHAVGCFPEAQAQWLASRPHSAGPLIVLMHHCPLGAPSFRWTPDRLRGASRALRLLEAVEVRMEILEDDRARFWRSATAAGTRLVLCGHVHRALLDRHDGVFVGLNGQSGAAWAGRTIAWYEIAASEVRQELEVVSDSRSVPLP
jgi:3',5'-cyclic AMP phosphodiesterase CpdA